MFRLFFGLCLLIHISSSQLITITLCSDDACLANCVSWVATSGKCTPCKQERGDCSIYNPSSIVTSSHMSLYTDSSCQYRVVGADNMAITIDSGCQRLIGSNSNPIGSYNASNSSAVIGGIIAGVVLLISIYVCSLCVCKWYIHSRQLGQSNYIIAPNGYLPHEEKQLQKQKQKQSQVNDYEPIIYIPYGKEQEQEQKQDQDPMPEPSAPQLRPL